MSAGALVRELLSRRVPHVLGVYLAAGWGLLEFADWAEGRLTASVPFTDYVMYGWILILPIVLFAAWSWGKGTPSSLAVASRRPTPTSIAVLPFVNLSDALDRDYLSDGISEELINTLSKVEGLQVVSRTSSFAYKEKSVDVRTLGRELSVGSILEGSVRVAGDRLRVTTQLIDASDGYQLWSERFDRQMEDVFAIEDEIAANVARVLRVILSDEEREGLGRLPTPSVEAYEFYLRGRQFLHQTRRRSLEYAREMFERAVAADPNYALAYAGLASSSAIIFQYYANLTEDLERADEASRRALELGPELAEAHAARGFALFLAKRLDEAEVEFKAAISLDPKLYEGYYYYGRACFQQGRMEEAAALFDRASQAREEYQAAFFAAQAREALGDHSGAGVAYERALQVAEKHMELNPDDPRAATMRAVALCRIGRFEEGVHWAKRALAIDPLDGGVRYNVACLYSLEGMTEEAIAALEEAVRVGFGNPEWMERDPDLDPLRGHPRFEALLERIRRDARQEASSTEEQSE